MPKRPSWRTWIGRAGWLIVGGLFTALVTFLSQGPDAIRKIPEIPSAISETATTVWQEYQIDRDLTGAWEFTPEKLGTTAQLPFVRLELDSKNGQISGGLFSPAVKKWTIYDMALVEGQRAGQKLRLTVFDFIYGKRTRLAELIIGFQEELSDGISDHMPALVDSELRAETIWQKSNVLPKKFILRRVNK